MQKTKWFFKKIFMLTGLYEKFEFSRLHLLYARFNNPLFFEHQKQFKHLCESRLPFGGLIFDVGANVGNKTDIYLSLGFRVLSIEPDIKNIQILKRRFGKNKKFTLIDKAISSNIGTAKFYMNAPGSAFNTLSIKQKEQIENNPEENKFEEYALIDTVSLDNLIQDYGIPDYIKIDVEGYELEVLQGLSTPIQSISFEANLPAFLAETIECIIKLSSLNKDTIFNYVTGDLEKFSLDTWQNSTNFVGILESTDKKYMEIFAKLPTHTNIT